MYKPARGGRSCEHFGGYKTINRIPYVVKCEENKEVRSGEWCSCLMSNLLSATGTYNVCTVLAPPHFAQGCELYQRNVSCFPGYLHSEVKVMYLLLKKCMKGGILV